jgi:serine/threonine protein kinase/class 3 adenylate cyclase
MLEPLRRKIHAWESMAAALAPEAASTLTRDTAERESSPPGEGLFDFLAPPQAEGELGWLAHYRVLRLLGTGGMGMVFHAEDCHLQRPVALKVMKPGLSASPNSRQRFLREARAAAQFQHDHLVTIYQVGEDREVPFLAMQLLQGRTLEDRLTAEGKLSPAEAVRIGREIASGLAAAHRHGLIHRDVKPANVWLEEGSGRVKILDFGLARTVENDAPLTESGLVVGTPAYMAPEQARGRAVDARSDLFSLGCILYRACTGEVPFTGDDAMAIMMALAVVDPPPPRQLNPAVPDELSRLILRLLTKDPAGRPATADEVATALEVLARPTDGPHEPAGDNQVVLLPMSLPPSLPARPAAASGSALRYGVRELLRESEEARGETYLSQLRLFLEELTCDLCRFEHVTGQGLPPDAVHIDREFYLGGGGFADVRVAFPSARPYFVEVKYGHSPQRLLRSLRRKYGTDTPAIREADRLVLLIDAEGRPDWSETETEVRACLPPHLRLEVWTQARLLAMLRERFGVRIGSITEENLLDVRQGIDRAKGFYAFGASSFAGYHHDPLREQLMWHFGFWRLCQLRESHGLSPRQVLTPGVYRGVAVLIANLCGFSGYYRDSRSPDIIADSLTSFYSKARYQILNHGGMIYQLAGDQVIGLFGIPDQRPEYLQDALAAAQGLLSVGISVSNHWQRHIDRVQETGGLRIGMALGDLQIVSQRPFSRTHVGAVGDPLQVAARLLDAAGPNEAAIINTFYQGVNEDWRARFQPIDPIEASNVGRIRAWKLPWEHAG